jgi:Phosphotransferase enzyme family
VNVLDQRIREIADYSATKLQGRINAGTLRSLIKPTTEARVADATTTFYIDGLARSDDCVLMVSPPDFPDVVGASAEAALSARAQLGGDLGMTVCAPILVDRWQGQSFAIYPRLQAFSQNRMVLHGQKRRAAAAILRWLSAVMDATAVKRTGAAEIEARFLRPLRQLINDDDIPERVRSSVQASLAAVEAGRVQTLTCLQHGDFWFGNIMFDRSSVPGMAPFVQRFKVIDWGSSRTDGYPGIDLVRFLLSTFGAGAHSVHALGRYCEGARSSLADLAVGCLCALGRLGIELDEFPKRNFVGLVSDIHDFLEKAQAFESLRRAGVGR